MQRKATRTRAATRRLYSRGSSNWLRNTAIVGGSLLSMAACVGAYVGYQAYERRHRQHEVDKETGCLLHAENPQAVVLMIDSTDPLAKQSGPRLRTAIMDLVNDLPRYSRVTLVAFGNQLADPLEIKFDGCLPGRRDDAGWDEGGGYLNSQFRKFDTKVKQVVASLEALPPANSSPIAEQVIRAASDRVLHWEGARRRLFLATDGLESVVYRTGRVTLPTPAANLLSGVDVEFFEVGNERDYALQTPSMRVAWANWFKAAGSTSVQMSAPGYPTVGRTAQ